jgi:hypothetical protein
MNGVIITTIHRGDMVEVLSGPHLAESDELQRYMVRVGSVTGSMLMTVAELGHPHGPVIPWLTTDAPVVNVQTDGTGLVRYPELESDLKEAREVRDVALRDLETARGELKAAKLAFDTAKAYLCRECDKLKAENKTLRARFESEITPDFIEWKAQQEQRMTTDYAKTGIAAHPIVKTLTADAEDAAWRLAGSQFVKLTRDPLSALLSRHLGPEDDALRGKVGEFLKTELGASMLAAFLSLGLSSLPEGNGVAPRLARELRVRAMAGATDVVADVITGPLRQVMATYLQDLPAAPPVPPSLPDGTHAHAPITAAVVGEEVGR